MPVHSEFSYILCNMQDQEMICPQFTCPPLPASCLTAEFMVLVYEYQVPRRPGNSRVSRGQVINVHCQTCQYCIDTPPIALSSLDAQSDTRRRRNVDHVKRSTDKVQWYASCWSPSKVRYRNTKNVTYVYIYTRRLHQSVSTHEITCTVDFVKHIVLKCWRVE